MSGYLKYRMEGEGGKLRKRVRWSSSMLSMTMMSQRWTMVCRHTMPRCKRVNQPAPGYSAVSVVVSPFTPPTPCHFVRCNLLLQFFVIQNGQLLKAEKPKQINPMEGLSVSGCLCLSDLNLGWGGKKGGERYLKWDTTRCLRQQSEPRPIVRNMYLQLNGCRVRKAEKNKKGFLLNVGGSTSRVFVWVLD